MEEVDAQLVDRCVNGDVRAWETVVKTYSGRMLNMAYRYTGNYSVAEELTQEVFLKIYQNMPRYSAGSGSFRNWAMRVGRNLIIDHYRAHKREKNVAGSEELETLDFKQDDPTPYETLHQRERSLLLRRGLEQLSFELREAVTLRDIEGYAYREISQMLEIPEGTVKSRINRGRIELAKVLRAERAEEADGMPAV